MDAFDDKALQEADLAHHWHPFTQMRGFDPSERMMVKGKGSYMWNSKGKEFLDAFAGLWSANAGHCHPKIVDAIGQQISELSVAPLFGQAHPCSALLAEELAMLAPGDLNRVFFSVQGSQAVDTSIKMARQYWKSRKAGGKYKIISRQRAYHGTSFGGTSAQGISANKVAFEPLLPGFSHIQAPCGDQCDLRCADELADEIEFQGPDTVAAFIFEPVMGSGGVIVPPNGYEARIREICDAYDVLMIADEVMTGFGRTGPMLAIEREDTVPDMLLLSKGLTSGHLPLAATVVKDDIFEHIVNGVDSDVELHTGCTFDGYPAACAAALANIEVFRDEELVARAGDMGSRMQPQLRSLLESDVVKDVRGIGMVAGVELEAGGASSGVSSDLTNPARFVANIAFVEGVIVRPIFQGKVVAIAPPLIVDGAEVSRIAETLKFAIGELEMACGG